MFSSCLSPSLGYHAISSLDNHATLKQLFGGQHGEIVLEHLVVGGSCFC